MNHLEELIELSQQLSSVLDDMEHGIISTGLDNLNGSVKHFCQPRFFISQFSSFDVLPLKSKEFPLELKTEVDGVIFHAFIRHNELHLIEDNPSNKKIPLAQACE